jgi:hypothetical protein
MTFTESNMRFDFSAFDSAEQYDSSDNQCAGLKIVDFVAENSGRQYFIEVKNYANTSDAPVIQAAMDRRQKTDYRMLADPYAAFPLEMGMKFKDSLFRWLASGKDFEKPIVLLLVINPQEAMKPKARLKIIKRIAAPPLSVPQKLECKILGLAVKAQKIALVRWMLWSDAPRELR